MAGAGYKLFNTGDVLTAAQVNTYLQEQAVMRFANATARTTALSGVLAEGMMSYLDDTNSVEVYNGSAWVSVSSDQTPLTTKGDLFTYSTTDTRLGVGANGTVLTANSATATGLEWAAAAASGDTFAAGKNKIINGDFAINQRAFTSNTTNGTYNFDRWYQQNSGGTTTVTPQNFTAGSAPVAGYEGRQFCQVITASQSAAGDYAQLTQAIEDVRTLAGQTATISFWAKANSGTPKIAVEVIQRFGSGGSPSADVQTYAGQATISTSWARYSITVAVPSLSGKTVGTSVNTSSTTWSFWLSAGANFNARTGSLGVQNNTFQIWGVQVEAGSSATTFQTATGNLAGELVACQRYFNRFVDNSTSNVGQVAHGRTDGNPAESQYTIRYNVDMRTTPTLTVSAAGDFKVNAAGSNSVATSITAAGITTKALALVVAHGSLGTNAAASIYGNATTAGRMDASAEL